MWARAAILDSAFPETFATAERDKQTQQKQSKSDLPNIRVSVAWDSFASIALWDQVLSLDNVDVELQLNDLDLVKTRSAHEITAGYIRDACGDAKSNFIMIARADHTLLICAKVCCIIRTSYRAVLWHCRP